MNKWVVIGLSAVVVFVMSVNLWDIKRNNIYSYENIVVHPGETLWEISGEYCPAWMDKRDYIALITRDNACTAEITAGQSINVRIYEK